jgi:hypothetical protein
MDSFLKTKLAFNYCCSAILLLGKYLNIVENLEML